MKTITIEMPMVSRCSVAECAYNTANSCHARAITIGDSVRPGCDTFMEGSPHIKQVNRVAGIGACKTASCKFNDDLECIAETIQVGMVQSEANCKTFVLR